MYKTLLRFAISIIIAIVYTLFFLSNQANTIIVEPAKYPEILETVHNNLEQYLGKKFIISGYVYKQEDFAENRFVIAQNVYFDSIPIIIGFLCENKSKINISNNENIKIEGTLDKCTFKNSTYPILLVNKIISN